MGADFSFETTLMILLSRLWCFTLRKVKTSIISELKNTYHIQQMFGLIAKFMTVRKYISKIPWRKLTEILIYTVLSVEFQSLLSQIIKVVTKLISVLIVAKFYFWNQYNHIKSIFCILRRKPRLARHLESQQ